MQLHFFKKCTVILGEVHKAIKELATQHVQHPHGLTEANDQTFAGKTSLVQRQIVIKGYFQLLPAKPAKL